MPHLCHKPIRETKARRLFKVTQLVNGKVTCTIWNAASQACCLEAVLGKEPSGSAVGRAGTLCPTKHSAATPVLNERFGTTAYKEEERKSKLGRWGNWLPLGISCWRGRLPKFAFLLVLPMFPYFGLHQRNACVCCTDYAYMFIFSPFMLYFK